MNYRRKIILFVIFFVSFPSFALGAQPVDTLRQVLEQAILVLEDPVYKGGTLKDVQYEKLKEIVQRVFDFAEFTRKALGHDRQSFTSKQIKEFTGVFAQFLLTTYLSIAQRKYSNERVTYLNQRLIADSRALVKTTFHHKGLEVPVDFLMLRRDGAWKVYDISLLGIGAARIYQSQFKAILLKESPSHLIARVKEKGVK